MISLATERLQLAGFPRGERSFVPGLHRLLSDPELMRFMNMETHHEPWDTAVYAGECAMLERHGGHACAIYERDGGAFVGVLTLAPDTAHSWIFGGYLQRTAHRKGYALEVTRAVAEWALTQERCHRVSAQCDVRNAAAVAVLERAGFELEGLLKRAWAGYGEPPRDAYSYAVTR